MATVHRRLLTVDGRAPQRGQADECLSPTSPEPLGFLLPRARAEYTFMPPVMTRAGRRRAFAIDYVPVAAGVPSLEWRGDCASFDLPGLMRGRITVEPTTFAVLRLEQGLMRAVDIPVRKDQRRDGWENRSVSSAPTPLFGTNESSFTILTRRCACRRRFDTSQRSGHLKSGASALFSGSRSTGDSSPTCAYGQSRNTSARAAMRLDFTNDGLDGPCAHGRMPGRT